MDRPGKFEHNQYVGDKRTQVVYDVDGLEPEHAHVIEELMSAEAFISFGPDTLAEAENRNYRLYAAQRRARDAAVDA